jgi:SAM-dependent methyltransferase
MSAAAHDELWDLENLRTARRLCDWMYEQFDPYVGARTVEIGAGIGTFSARLAARPEMQELVLIEPEPPCAAVLERDFADDARITVARDVLPESPALRERAGQVDFVLCQNVLEHIGAEIPAVRAMASALRPGGRLTLLVPAHPRLYGNLDRLYGHHRRYTREHLAEVVAGAGLELDRLYSFNLLGIAGWWANRSRSSPGISRRSLQMYELLLRAWQPVERRMQLRWGLSLIAHARKPPSSEPLSGGPGREEDGHS